MKTSFRQAIKNIMSGKKAGSINQIENHESYVGIDICKGGWLSVILDEKNYDIQRSSNIKDAINLTYNPTSLIIDIPIGLPENYRENSKRPDIPARIMLSGSRKSSIFPVPCRQAVYSNSLEEAQSINKLTVKKSMTLQSYGIAKYIREVDCFLNDFPEYKNNLIESHPEVIYTVLNHGVSVDASKKTPQGLNERIDILAKFYPKATTLKKLLQSGVYPKSIHDDIVDAFSLAVAGYLGSKNGYRTIPVAPETDNRGLLMQMIIPRTVSKLEG